MKRFATVLVALGFASAGSAAFAEQSKEQVKKQESKPQPVQMTEAQMDNVAAGIAVLLIDTVDANVGVQAPVAANVQVGVLANQIAGAGAAAGRQVGRINN